MVYSRSFKFTCESRRERKDDGLCFQLLVRSVHASTRPRVHGSTGPRVHVSFFLSFQEAQVNVECVEKVMQVSSKSKNKISLEYRPPD